MTEPAATPAPYKDDDLVYVDPESKTIVGPIEWSRNGNPKSLPVPPKEEVAEGKGRRRAERKFFPFGTFRAMKRAFSLEGKQRRSESNITVDEALAKAMKDAF